MAAASNVISCTLLALNHLSANLITYETGTECLAVTEMLEFMSKLYEQISA